MTIDQKYFPEFKQQFIDVGDGIKINTLVGGSGSEAVLLLHGHPETHLIWRFLTPGLVGRYTVVLTDLRGYGDSSKPEGAPDHANYSKRAMGDDQFAVMSKLGFEKFHGVGHDRGARVLHRMVMDHPERLLSCTMMDILPTYDMYRDTSQEFATKYWHWFFYIQGKGFPERVLASDPEYFVNYNLNLKIGPAAKSRFPQEILDEYVRCLRDPMTFHGICEDYRASATIDMELDKADRERIIQVPILALWGKDGVVGKLWDVMSGWQERAANVEGLAVAECGHFVPEEQPEVVLEALLEFLAKYPG
ncbi:alpha/beta fold hydrolase [Phascolarctobacterium sp.]